MDELPVTWSRATRVWWSFFWRMSLLSIAFGLILVAVGVIAALALGLSTEQTRYIDNSRWLQIVFFSMGAVVTLIAMKLVLTKNWNDFRIALIARPSSERDGNLTRQ